MPAAALTVANAWGAAEMPNKIVKRGGGVLFI
jgi:hypothetical protein